MSKVIALDIGGTTIKGGLVRSGKILEHVTAPTEADKSKQKIIQNILKVIRQLKKGPITGIGIGMPGFTGHDGRLVSCPHIPAFEGQKIYAELKKKIEGKVRIENDANCFALGEHTLGAGKGTNNMIGIIQGTGYGVGLIINKALYNGSGGAGEYGHSFWNVYAEKDFEAICSGTGITKNYRLFSGRTRPAQRIFADVQSAASARVIAEYYRHFALSVSYMVNLLNPDKVVIGGGVSKSFDYPYLSTLVKQYSYPPLTSRLKVVKSKLGDDAGILGAACLIKSFK